MMKRLIRYFGNGLLFLIPVGGTVWVVYTIFSSIDKWVYNQISDPNQPPLGWWHHGFGVLITLAVILVVGVLTTLFITRPITQLVERLFGRVPLVKLLYSSIKDLIGAFVGDKKKFDQPVMVTLVPDSGVKSLGFVTRKSMEMLGLKDEVAVYCPQSYNFAGSVLIVPRQHITPIDGVDSSDVMAFVVSGGVSGLSGDEGVRDVKVKN